MFNKSVIKNRQNMSKKYIKIKILNLKKISNKHSIEN